MARHGTISTEPPIILAIENAGMCGSVALVNPHQCFCEYTLQSHVTHSKRLIASIEKIMTEAGLGWDAIDSIAVSMGPGSFTGLRIGLATAKGLAMGTGKKLIGIPTLDGLASQLPFAERQICAILDARKNEVFTAFYRFQGPALERTSDYRAITAEKLAAAINIPTILIGDGAQLYKDVFVRQTGGYVDIMPPDLYFPRGCSIGRLAVQAWQQGNFIDPLTAVPIYVRASDAEINFPEAG